MSKDESLVRKTDALARRLETVLDDECIVRDKGERLLLSSDIYAAGVTAALAIRPAERAPRSSIVFS